MAQLGVRIVAGAVLPAFFTSPSRIPAAKLASSAQGALSTPTFTVFSRSGRNCPNLRRAELKQRTIIARVTQMEDKRFAMERRSDFCPRCREGKPRTTAARLSERGGSLDGQEGGTMPSCRGASWHARRVFRHPGEAGIGFAFDADLRRPRRSRVDTRAAIFQCRYPWLMHAASMPRKSHGISSKGSWWIHHPSNVVMAMH